MDSLSYELLAWLDAGNSVFRPRGATRDAEEQFREVVALLARLREKGFVDYLDRHVARGSSGIYLMVGPVQLTGEGKAALECDCSFGPRSSQSNCSTTVALVSSLPSSRALRPGETTILVVDDDVLMLRLVEQTLRVEGYSVCGPPRERLTQGGCLRSLPGR